MQCFWKRLARLCVGTFIFLVVFPAASFAAYSFTDVDYPGAAWTVPNKINDSGQIVGQYFASGVRHGFLLSGGTYTTIDCPDPYTAGSNATAINNSGQIVGYCSVPGGINGFYGSTRSFILSGGVLTFLPDAGSYGGASTAALAINDSGQIAGNYADVCLCTGHAFLFSGGTYTTIDLPSSAAYGINNSGQIVGDTAPADCFGCGIVHGFLRSSGVDTVIDYPGISSFTEALGINDSGQIVGEYHDDSSAHGFLLTGGVFTTIDHPNAQLTEAEGINSRGQIVGVYVDLANILHGFVTAPPYTATIQPPINADGSSVFNAKRGAVPVKFTLAVSGTSTCQLPPATISLTRTAGGTLGAINESDFLQPSDTGSNFRVSSCQYVYNLGSSSLGVGTYLVQINIGGSSVGTGTFSLK